MSSPVWFLADRAASSQCDETKPECQKCAVYGVVCNYTADISDLQLPAESPQWELKESDGMVAVTAPLLSTRVITVDAKSALGLGTNDMALLTRFRFRTLLALGGSAVSEIYETQLLQLTCSVSFQAGTFPHRAVLSVNLSICIS